MASMKATKPQGSPPASSGAAKVQQPKAGGAKPAPKKAAAQKPQQPKMTVPKAAPQAKDAK